MSQNFKKLFSRQNKLHFSNQKMRLLLNTAIVIAYGAVLRNLMVKSKDLKDKVQKITVLVDAYANLYQECSLSYLEFPVRELLKEQCVNRTIRYVLLTLITLLMSNNITTLSCLESINLMVVIVVIIMETKLNVIYLVNVKTNQLQEI
ncbi:Hypothetical_protein [Hexamita inflata]|uniref:Hypothetical_protein n=1 Tax=Hexamita inflata TaxID=28002 RepID=A0AA86NN93_9EUKA|nr:Hypothetical protein HINF_LOCUS10314 [Hexamita inflata]